MSDDLNTSWERLNQLVEELFEAIPAPLKTAEVLHEYEQWQRAYYQATHGFGLSDDALNWWVDHYNELRRKVIERGLIDAPPAARRGPTSGEAIRDAARNVVVEPAKAAAAGFSGGLLLALLAFAFWGRK